jgi:hypothetical protein
MTAAQRILFGVVASMLLVLGLVKAAESFDPVFLGGRLHGAAEKDFGGSATTRLS